VSFEVPGPGCGVLVLSVALRRLQFVAGQEEVRGAPFEPLELAPGAAPSDGSAARPA
jgi:hypothetical protein